MKTIEISIPCNTKLFGNTINFNPSIVYIGNNRFLVSFFAFRRGEYGHPCDIQPQANIYDPYHMWYGGPGSETYWEEDWPYGLRGTGYMIIKITNREVSIHQIFDNILGIGYDTRLVNTPSGIIATSSEVSGFEYQNVWGINRTKYGLSPPTCKVECYAIYYLILGLTYTGHTDSYELQNAEWEGEPLCPTLQDQDKNWSLFMANKKIYTSQWLIPKHTVITLQNPTCQIIMEPNVNVFYKIQNFYKNTVRFSLSTPALIFLHNMSEMLGVGHIVLMGDLLPIDTAAYNFNIQNTLPKHPINQSSYMMFFYTFDPDTFEILRVSPAFYPPNTIHGVVFASGLTFSDNDYIVSYGEGDIKMKLFFISLIDIDQLLLPQNDINDNYIFMYL